MSVDPLDFTDCSNLSFEILCTRYNKHGSNFSSSYLVIVFIDVTYSVCKI